MEVQRLKDDETEKALEASVVENNTEDKDTEMEADADNNVGVAEISVGGKDEEIQKSEEAFTDAKQEHQASETLAEENKMASNEAVSPGKKAPRVTTEKTKTMKRRVKRRLVKGKTIAGTASVKCEDVTKQQGISEGANEDLTPAINEEGEKGAEASFGGNDEEVKKVIEGSAEDFQSYGRDEKVAEAESFEEETQKRLKEETKIAKTQLKRLQGKNVKGMNLDILVTDNKMVKRDAEALPERDEKEVEKVIEDSLEALDNTKPAKKKPSRKRKTKAKIGKAPATEIAKIDTDTPQIQKNDKGNSNLLVGSRQRNNIGKLNSQEGNTTEEGLRKSVEKNKQEMSTHDKTYLTEDGKHKRRRQGTQVLGVNKKPKNEENKEKSVIPKKKEKLGGLIFMCNAKTKPDCFRFRVMGVSENKKDVVMGIKPGLKLFLYDYDLKLLYGIFQASSVGGLKLERKAFGGSFPAQVRFEVIEDCEPLPETIFRKAIQDNYNNKNKFKTELNRKQVFRLRKLFRPAAVPLTTQLTHPRLAPVTRDADRKRYEKDIYASGSSRTTYTHEHRVSPPRRDEPPPRRDEPPSRRDELPPRRDEPRDLYLSEREYRAYGLRRGQTSQHYQIPPANSHRTVDRDRVALRDYNPDFDRDRLLMRHMDIERHHLREAHHSNPLYIPERDYLTHDHRRELLAPLPQNTITQPLSAAVQDSYTRDLYHSYDYRAPVGERLMRVYPSSPGRDEDLYLRYATADSLAEYYRNRRYEGMADPALPPSSVTSRYSNIGSSSYPYR